MELIATGNIESDLENKYVLLDTDFLGTIYKDKELLTGFLTLTRKSNLMLDPMVVFEFLRDVFLPTEAFAKENFVNDELFSPTNNYTTVFTKIQNNALLLSKIYAHNGRSKGVSTTDLYLAARLMTLPSNSVLITGNKKDYPLCVFSLLSVINVENRSDESIGCYSILKLDQAKLQKAHQKLLKIVRR